MPKAKIQLSTLVKKYKQAYLPIDKDDKNTDKTTTNPKAAKTGKPNPT